VLSPLQVDTLAIGSAKDEVRSLPEFQFKGPEQQAEFFTCYSLSNLLCDMGQEMAIEVLITKLL